MAAPAQPGIRADLPSHSLYLSFQLDPGASSEAVLAILAELELGEGLVVGLGGGLVSGLGRQVSGLRAFPQIESCGLGTVSTPAALWCWLRGSDRGELLHAQRDLVQRFQGLLSLEDATDGFMFREGRDLTGYVDGTENPEGEAAEHAAFVEGAGPSLDGSSFVAVQRWVHDLAAFDAMSEGERDYVIGRRISDNEELDDAPPTAHVKRTAQENFDPEAFVLRRSMPWSDPRGEGLVFVAFGKSFDAFEALLMRMMGADDDIVDALYRFTKPVTGAYFWCPPIKGGRLLLDAVR
jgi:porphyrinogen peroxidase